MTPISPLRTNVRGVGFLRISGGVVVAGVLAYTYTAAGAVGDNNPFNYFGYFTNQTSLLACVVLIATGALMIRRRRVPAWLTTIRGVATACLLIVAVVYNVLVPGTGSAPLWVSVLLHGVFPLAALLDWLLVGDRPPLRWRELWVVLPYPTIWLTVVLIRGVTDGWVPYGFLLPEHGAASLTGHIVGLLTALLAAGALVWSASRSRGIYLTGAWSHLERCASFVRLRFPLRAPNISPLSYLLAPPALALWVEDATPLGHAAALQRHATAFV